MLDIAVAYNKYGFLGNEFLTYLWYVIENKEINVEDHEHIILEVGSKIVLEKTVDDSKEKITITGDDAGLEEGKLALRKGAVVIELALVYKTGEHEWKFTIKGESFDVCNLKTPLTESVKKQEEFEGAILEKHYLCNKMTDFIDKMFNRFMKIRLSENWENEVSEISEWIK